MRKSAGEAEGSRGRDSEVDENVARVWLALADRCRNLLQLLVPLFVLQLIQNS